MKCDISKRAINFFPKHLMYVETILWSAKGQRQMRYGPSTHWETTQLKHPNFASHNLILNSTVEG